VNTHSFLGKGSGALSRSAGVKGNVRDEEGLEVKSELDVRFMKSFENRCIQGGLL